MSARISLFAVVVEDMARSLEFYRLLGVEIPAEADAAPHVEVVLDGGVRLAWDTAATIRSYDPQWQAPTGGHRVAIAFEFPDTTAVDAKYAELVDAGYEGHLKPWDAVWGQRYAIVKDPDGTVIDLFAPLPGA
ncbi:glyoxalase [Streptomyces sp. NRRL B-1677]|uniref:VOC family protein n=1 Tax=Streptomyces sp. NRRL B-1677 TaxID=2682966 RepID=UPI0018929AFE|nr:VOC family protein [Streptomyces sp. NRRL B-1677]MBF6047138.1 glyoxalase [Streptomyces sp. NRRL B-1677]